MNEVTLNRTTFATSRLLEYFSEKELTLQTGHGRELWPAVVAKELIDNALDAAEDSDVAPVIGLTIEPGSITVSDNGPGIAPEIVSKILDFSTRTSSKDFYISPTRGAQGNALKTILAIPYVLNGTEQTTVEITSRGVQHILKVSADQIRQEPVVEHATEADAKSQLGTVVKVQIDTACLIDPDQDPNFLHLAIGYYLLNPHARFVIATNDEAFDFTARDPQWRKWRPHNPTSAHWYSHGQLEGLIAAYLSADRGNGGSRYLREFVSEFKGLSASAKQKDILGSLGWTGAKLEALVRGDKVDSEKVKALLAAMRDASAPVKPEALGIIGGDSIRAYLARICNEHSLRYKAVKDYDSHGRPFVVEAAFGVTNSEHFDRTLIAGVNFTPCLANPFQSVGAGRFGLGGLLRGQYVTQESPAMVMVHVTAPYLRYTDRGKSTVDLDSEMSGAITEAVLSVTKDWEKIQRQKIRNSQSAQRAQDRMLRSRPDGATLKSVVWENMPAVYDKVSGGNTLPAAARQLFYAMRPIVLEQLPDKELRDVYFTQTLLPDYLSEHPKETENWNVVYDARGHLIEPHTKHSIPLGTLDVRRYVSGFSAAVGTELYVPGVGLRVSTHGPENRFRNVLFIEKEGFFPLLEAAQIAENYDVALMTTKGMSTTAARELMESMPGVRFLVLHDFDKAGFSIAGTLQRETRRYKFDQPPEVIDLGLRLADVRAEKLTGEPFMVGQDASGNLQENGATEDEIAYLTGELEQVLEDVSGLPVLRETGIEDLNEYAGVE